MAPASGHLSRGMRNAPTAKITGHVLHQTASIVIVKPVFQVMEPRKIIAGTLTAAIAVHLDVVQQTFRRPIGFGFVYHSPKSRSPFEKRPAIHPVDIYRWRFDSVVDLKSKIFVVRS